MKRTLLFLLLLPTLVVADNNLGTKECLEHFNYSQDNFDTFDWSAAAWCASQRRTAANNQKLMEMRDFLAANPRYRVPGQSMNKCWGKEREMPFESAGIETNGNSMRAWVNYKDTMPTGCYENGPWDNRDEN